MGLLSVEALEWMKSVGYASMSHDERMLLIREAKVLFPECETDDEADDGPWEEEGPFPWQKAGMGMRDFF